MTFRFNPITGNLDLVGSSSSSGSGDVVGPASATDNAIARYDLATGKLIQNSTITLADDGVLQNVNAVQFDITPTAVTPAEGLLQWNATDGTLDLGMSGGDITQQIGQELFLKVRNPPAGSTITNASVVYISGRTGVFPDVALARSDSETTSAIVGIATQDIASPAFGYVTTLGYVRGIKTDYTGAGIWGTTWVTGDTLYVSKTTAGQLTNIEPSAPHHSDVVATVGVVSATQGSILVNITKHKTFQELSDVNGTPLTTTGQIPVWDNTGGYFDFTSNISDFTSINTDSFGLVVDGGGSVLTTGSKGYKYIPWNCTVTGWNILGDISGSIVIDVKRSGVSLSGTEKPTLASSTSNQDLALSTWTTSLLAGDVIEFIVDSASTLKRATLTILVTKV